MSRRERIVSARRDDLMAFPAVDKTEPQRIFELLGQKGEVTPERFALRNAYVVALNAYRGKAWEKACADFEACLAIYLCDPPSKLFLERIAHLRVTRPSCGSEGRLVLGAEGNCTAALFPFSAIRKQFR